MTSVAYLIADQSSMPNYVEPSDDNTTGWIAVKGTTLILMYPRTPGPVGITGEMCWNASGLQTCTATDVWKKLSYDDSIATLTGKNITGATNIVHSDALKTATGSIDVASASAPSAGQVLMASGPTAASWAHQPMPPTFFGRGTNDIVYSANTTLTADVYARNITVNPGVIVNTTYRIFANGTLTVGAGASINSNGNNASGQTGGTALVAGSLGGGSAGGAGGNSGLAGLAGGSMPSQTQVGPAPGGGAGGSGNALLSAAGAGGLTSPILAINGGPMPANDITCALRGRDMNNVKLTGGSGGGGGGGGGSSGGGSGGGAPIAGGSGGGGGGGAGVVMIAASIISGAGIISANGGAGGAGSTTGAGNRAGGGGGGGGGLVIVVKNNFAGGFTSAQITATGGIGGAAGGTGGNPGSAGMAGNVVVF